MEANDREEIRRLLSRINDAWLQGRPAELNEYFHRDVVIRGPGFQELGRGRAACVASYEDFVRQATVRELKSSEPSIDLYGDTAVAACSWEITYEWRSQSCQDSGHELFIFQRDAGRWWAIWRALLPSPQPQVSASTPKGV